MEFEESLVADRTSFEEFEVDGSTHCGSSPRAAETHPAGAFVVKVAGGQRCNSHIGMAYFAD